MVPLLGCLTLLVGATWACNIQGIEECNGYEELEQSFRIAFLPQDVLSQKCRDLKSALNCAFQSKYTEDCPESDLVSLNGARGLTYVVCQQNPEFESYHRCLSSSGILEEVQYQCFEHLEASDVCRQYGKFLQCCKEKATAKCDEAHGKYMEYLAHQFIMPYAKLFKCENSVDDPDLLKEETTTTTAASTKMSSSSSSSSSSRSTTASASRTATVTKSTTAKGGMGDKNSTSSGGDGKTSRSVSDNSGSAYPWTTSSSLLMLSTFTLALCVTATWV